MTPFDDPRRAPDAPLTPPRLDDGFGRRISYLRVSVTDRCDLRCVYCMPQAMQFLPRHDVLSLEELDRLCSLFIAEGVTKLRLTGGEPLVRRGLLDLVESLSRHLKTGALRELTLTTNGTQLETFAEPLARLGVRRINVSLDTLDPDLFRRLTRGGDLDQVLAGLRAAKRAGLKIRLNAVALAGDNRGELLALIAFAHREGFDIAFIETMPLGEIETDRTAQFYSLAEAREEIAAVYTLDPVPSTSGGPARTFKVRETGGGVGFITPLSDNFCSDCNRVRLTCTGVLHTCLGHEEGADLRSPLRSAGALADGDAAVLEAIRAALARKPERHDFKIHKGAAPAVRRHMSTTGG